MRNLLARYWAQEDGDEAEQGFTLIELLIVIVVLGILAAVTVFALSSVGGKSAQSACNSDAASVNTAIAAYDAQTGYVAGTAGTTAVPAPTSPAVGPPVVTSNLVPTYIQSFPSNGSHYTISIGTAAANTGLVMVAAPSGATPVVWTPGSTACNTAS
jgi:prepilin-type N-terminal cleavage/methylation domain-containing protein